jgi:Transglutaminase-like superfamily
VGFLVLRAYLALLRFEILLARGDFAALYNAVRRSPRPPRHYDAGTIDQICSAVDLACIWYWKEALCLQRSAATTCLLKKHGIPAQMVIGAQHIPFKSHAWVEVDGRVVNDKSYISEVYAVLDRC